MEPVVTEQVTYKEDWCDIGIGWHCPNCGEYIGTSIAGLGEEVDECRQCGTRFRCVATVAVIVIEKESA